MAAAAEISVDGASSFIRTGCHFHIERITKNKGTALFNYLRDWLFKSSIKYYMVHSSAETNLSGPLECDRWIIHLVDF